MADTDLLARATRQYVQQSSKKLVDNLFQAHPLIQMFGERCECGLRRWEFTYDPSAQQCPDCVAREMARAFLE